MVFNCFESDYLRRVVLNDLEVNDQMLISLENYKLENFEYESAETNMKLFHIKSEINLALELLEKI